MSMERISILIVGSGPAGCTAAIYAARAGMPPLVFAGAQVGGQLIQTTEVENFPGFDRPILGAELMERMQRQAIRFGARWLSESAQKIERVDDFFVVEGEYTTVEAEAVIVATGSVARWLEVPGEAEFRGYGVSGCATCDGFFFRGRDVAVVGGGNTAVTDALYLADFAQRVTVIHRRDTLRADHSLQDRLFQKSNVRFMWNSEVVEICGEENPRKVKYVLVRNVRTFEISECAIEGVFVAVGHIPQTKWLQGIVGLDDRGYIQTQGGARTTCPGLFAAGDVMDPHYQQAVTAAGNGCRAALDAVDYLRYRLGRE